MWFIISMYADRFAISKIDFWHLQQKNFSVDYDWISNASKVDRRFYKKLPITPQASDEPMKKKTICHKKNSAHACHVDVVLLVGQYDWFIWPLLGNSRSQINSDRLVRFRLWIGSLISHHIRCLYRDFQWGYYGIWIFRFNCVYVWYRVWVIRCCAEYH